MRKSDSKKKYAATVTSEETLSRKERRRLQRLNGRHNLKQWVDIYIRRDRRERAMALWPHGWKMQLALVLDEFGGLREDGTRASHQTRETRGDILYLTFQELHDELGCKINDVRTFSTRHVRKLLQLWISSGIASATIATRLTVLRLFAGWIGKTGMVPQLKGLARLGFDPSIAQRTTVAVENKAWDGIDKEGLFAAIERVDVRFGLVFRAQDAFGLRRLEAIRFCPHEHDRGTHLAIVVGSKGGRPREIPVASAEARALLDRCKSIVPTGDSLSGKDLSLLKAKNRYNYVARKFGITRGQLGVTGHGLRHGYAHQLFRSAFGQEPPVLDLSCPQPTGPEAMAKRLEIAEALGHSRPGVTTAYTGPARPKPQRDGVDSKD